MSLPKILVVTTGGSISNEGDNAKSFGAVRYNAPNLLKLIPEIRQIATIELMDMMSLDSIDILPEDWLMLAEYLHDNINRYDGIVVTHGLDTMTYTASAIAFMLQNLPIPIVFAGIYKPLSESSFDARNNFVAALKVAAQADLAEVCIVNDHKIHRPALTRLLRATDARAYTTIGVPHLAEISDTFHFNFPVNPRGKRKVKFTPTLDAHVGLIVVHPGFDPDIISQYRDHNYRGFLILAYGSGCVPSHSRYSLLPAIKAATDDGIPVLVTSLAALGGAVTVRADLEKKLTASGATLIPNMLWETAWVKLMWALGQTSDYAKVLNLINTNFVHEITNPADASDKISVD